MYLYLYIWESCKGAFVNCNVTGHLYSTFVGLCCCCCRWMWVWVPLGKCCCLLSSEAVGGVCCWENNSVAGHLSVEHLQLIQRFWVWTCWMTLVILFVHPGTKRMTESECQVLQCIALCPQPWNLSFDGSSTKEHEMSTSKMLHCSLQLTRLL